MNTLSIQYSMDFYSETLLISDILLYPGGKTPVNDFHWILARDLFRYLIFNCLPQVDWFTSITTRKLCHVSGNVVGVRLYHSFLRFHTRWNEKHLNLVHWLRSVTDAESPHDTDLTSVRNKLMSGSQTKITQIWYWSLAMFICPHLKYADSFYSLSILNLGNLNKSLTSFFCAKTFVYNLLGSSTSNILL